MYLRVARLLADGTEDSFGYLGVIEGEALKRLRRALVMRNGRGSV